MTKEDVIYGATKLIERIARDKNLEVKNLGTGHAFDHSLWKGCLKDESGIPEIRATKDGYSIVLRSFWDAPEIDVRRQTDVGEELLVLNYYDAMKNKESDAYEHFGDFKVHEVRVDAYDYQKCLNDIQEMIWEIEWYIKERVQN